MAAAPAEREQPVRASDRPRPDVPARRESRMAVPLRRSGRRRRRRPSLDASGRLRLAEITDRLDRRLARVPGPAAAALLPGTAAGRPALGRRRAVRHSSTTSTRRAVEAPGGDAQLLEAAARLDGRLLDRSRPLWELWFLTGLTRRSRRRAAEAAPLRSRTAAPPWRSWDRCSTSSPTPRTPSRPRGRPSRSPGSGRCWPTTSPARSGRSGVASRCWRIRVDSLERRRVSSPS